MISRTSGFTLVELMVVLLVLALGSATVLVNMHSNLQVSLDSEAQRLQAVLENAKAQARSRHSSLKWQADAKGFTLSPTNDASVVLLRMAWIASGTVSDPDSLWISSEPVQQPMRLALRHAGLPRATWVLETDGVKSFAWKP